MHLRPFSGFLGRNFLVDLVLIVFVAFNNQMECCWTETAVVMELLIWILMRLCTVSNSLDVLNHCTVNVTIIIIPCRKTSEDKWTLRVEFDKKCITLN